MRRTSLSLDEESVPHNFTFNISKVNIADCCFTTTTTIIQSS